MNRTKKTDVKSKVSSKPTDRQLEAQDQTPPDEGGQTKVGGVLPAMGDAE